MAMKKFATDLLAVKPRRGQSVTVLPPLMVVATALLFISLISLIPCTAIINNPPHQQFHGMVVPVYENSNNQSADKLIIYEVRVNCLKGCKPDDDPSIPSDTHCTVQTSHDPSEEAGKFSCSLDAEPDTGEPGGFKAITELEFIVVSMQELGGHRRSHSWKLKPQFDKRHKFNMGFFTPSPEGTPFFLSFQIDKAHPLPEVLLAPDARVEKSVEIYELVVLRPEKYDDKKRMLKNSFEDRTYGSLELTKREWKGIEQFQVRLDKRNKPNGPPSIDAYLRDYAKPTLKLVLRKVPICDYESCENKRKGRIYKVVPDNHHYHIKCYDKSFPVAAGRMINGEVAKIENIYTATLEMPILQNNKEGDIYTYTINTTETYDQQQWDRVVYLSKEEEEKEAEEKRAKEIRKKIEAKVMSGSSAKEVPAPSPPLRPPPPTAGNTVAHTKNNDTGLPVSPAAAHQPSAEEMNPTAVGHQVPPHLHHHQHQQQSALKTKAVGMSTSAASSSSSSNLASTSTNAGSEAASIVHDANAAENASTEPLHSPPLHPHHPHHPHPVAGDTSPRSSKKKKNKSVSTTPAEEPLTKPAVDEGRKNPIHPHHTQVDVGNISSSPSSLLKKRERPDLISIQIPGRTSEPASADDQVPQKGRENIGSKAARMLAAATRSLAAGSRHLANSSSSDNAAHKTRSTHQHPQHPIAVDDAEDTSPLPSLKSNNRHVLSPIHEGEEEASEHAHQHSPPPTNTAAGSSSSNPIAEEVPESEKGASCCSDTLSRMLKNRGREKELILDGSIPAGETPEPAVADAVQVPHVHHRSPPTNDAGVLAAAESNSNNLAALVRNLANSENKKQAANAKKPSTTSKPVYLPDGPHSVAGTAYRMLKKERRGGKEKKLLDSPDIPEGNLTRMQRQRNEKEQERWKKAREKKEKNAKKREEEEERQKEREKEKHESSSDNNNSILSATEPSDHDEESSSSRLIKPAQVISSSLSGAADVAVDEGETAHSAVQLEGSSSSGTIAPAADENPREVPKTAAVDNWLGDFFVRNAEERRLRDEKLARAKAKRDSLAKEEEDKQKQKKQNNSLITDEQRSAFAEEEAVENVHRRDKEERVVEEEAPPPKTASSVSNNNKLVPATTAGHFAHHQEEIPKTDEEQTAKMSSKKKLKEPVLEEEAKDDDDEDDEQMKLAKQLSKLEAEERAKYTTGNLVIGKAAQSSAVDPRDKGKGKMVDPPVKPKKEKPPKVTYHHPAETISNSSNSSTAAVAGSPAPHQQDLPKTVKFNLEAKEEKKKVGKGKEKAHVKRLPPNMEGEEEEDESKEEEKEGEKEEDTFFDAVEDLDSLHQQVPEEEANKHAVEKKSEKKKSMKSDGKKKVKEQLITSTTKSRTTKLMADAEVEEAREDLGNSNIVDDDGNDLPPPLEKIPSAEDGDLRQMAPDDGHGRHHGLGQLPPPSNERLHHQEEHANRPPPQTEHPELGAPEPLAIGEEPPPPLERIPSDEHGDGRRMAPAADEQAPPSDEHPLHHYYYNYNNNHQLDLSNAYYNPFHYTLPRSAPSPPLSNDEQYHHYQPPPDEIVVPSATVVAGGWRMAPQADEQQQHHHNNNSQNWYQHNPNPPPPPSASRPSASNEPHHRQEQHSPPAPPSSRGQEHEHARRQHSADLHRA